MTNSCYSIKYLSFLTDKSSKSVCTRHEKRSILGICYKIYLAIYQKSNDTISCSKFQKYLSVISYHCNSTNIFLGLVSSLLLSIRPITVSSLGTPITMSSSGRLYTSMSLSNIVFAGFVKIEPKEKLVSYTSLMEVDFGMRRGSFNYKFSLKRI